MNKTRTKFFTYALLATSLFLGSCAQPELTRRYQHVKFSEKSKTKLVRIGGFVKPTSPAASNPAVLQLSERGQKALVDQIGAKEASSGGILASLGGKMGPKGTKGDTVDRTKFKKRIIISVVKNDEVENPADRIAKLNIDLTHSTGDGKITSWDKFSTKYETVDLGKIALEQSQQFQIGAEVAAPASAAIPVKGNVSYTAARKMNEEVSLKQRYIVLTGILAGNKAELFLEGVVGIDLTGNITVDVDIEAAPRMPVIDEIVEIGTLENEGVWTTDALKISVDLKRIKVPKNTNPIKYDLGGSYVMRQVDNSWRRFYRFWGDDRTIVEGDDYVKMIPGDLFATNVELVREGELEVKVWKISVDTGLAKLDLRLGARGPSLYLQSYSQALDVRDWLRDTQNTSIGRHALYAGARALTAADLSNLEIIDLALN